jgi:hypothetical protein
VPPYKRFAKQNLEIDGIHFRRFESKNGIPARREPGGAGMGAFLEKRSEKHFQNK